MRCGIIVWALFVRHLEASLTKQFLKGDWAKVCRVIGAKLLVKQHNESFVNPLEIGVAAMEIIEKVQKIQLDEVPILLIEGGAKTVRARACKIIHSPKG